MLYVKIVPSPNKAGYLILCAIQEFVFSYKTLSKEIPYCLNH